MTKRGIRMGLISQKSFYLKLFKGLYKKFINFIILRKSHANIIEISIQPQYLYNFISTLKANSLTQLKILNDICVIDYPERTNRFELNYNLLSVKYNFRVFLKTYTSSYISSVTSIFSCAN
jgi:NADH:ubiquinone oxidoreductase subunit C